MIMTLYPNSTLCDTLRSYLSCRAVVPPVLQVISMTMQLGVNTPYLNPYTILPVTSSNRLYTQEFNLLLTSLMQLSVNTPYLKDISEN